MGKRECNEEGRERSGEEERQPSHKCVTQFAINHVLRKVSDTEKVHKGRRRNEIYRAMGQVSYSGEEKPNIFFHLPISETSFVIGKSRHWCPAGGADGE